MERMLAGKTALVTGAGRGIGRAIALGLAREGAAVVVVSRTRTQIDQVVKEITSMGGRAVSAVADVAEARDVEASILEAKKAFGAVDILVNNAGDNKLGPIDGLDPGEWWRQIEVNLRGPYLYCRTLAPEMAKRKWGRIINMSSVMGKRGGKYCTAYCSAKHGIIGFTRALAIDFAESGVTVNAICPGFVETELTASTFQQRSELFNKPIDVIKKHVMENIPQKVVITPEEIVPAVLFFASEGSLRTTGEALNVSAGQVMH